MTKNGCCISAVRSPNSPSVSVTLSGTPLELITAMTFLMRSFLKRGLTTLSGLQLMAVLAAEDLDDD
nr:hypothetical protein [uncultured Dysosmobacter sp.]